MLSKYKNILFLFILISSILFASSAEIEKKICNKLLEMIFQEKSSIKIWHNSKNSYKILNHNKFIFVKTPDFADILIVDHYEEILADKPIFVRKYHLLKKYRDRAIGGFYWQKGRPNIIFIKDNLEKYGINIPDKLKKYIEEI